MKSAFLNGLLVEEIYVDQPEGFLVLGSEDKVYKLHKAIYGLKQAQGLGTAELIAILCIKALKEVKAKQLCM